MASSAITRETGKYTVSTPSKRTVGRGAEYYEYLQSDAWRETRIRYLKSRLPKECFVCRKPWENAFVFHHRTYKNLGCERLMDIVPMCRPCHELLHETKPNRPAKGLWGLTTQLRRKHAKRMARR